MRCAKAEERRKRKGRGCNQGGCTHAPFLEVALHVFHLQRLRLRLRRLAQSLLLLLQQLQHHRLLHRLLQHLPQVGQHVKLGDQVPEADSEAAGPQVIRKGMRCFSAAREEAGSEAARPQAIERGINCEQRRRRVWTCA